MKFVSKKHIKIINSSIENCFKTPIYCDVKKIMTGYGVLPPSEGVIHDANWANPKGHRTVLAFGKPLCTERILSRLENEYWKYELVDFQQSTFFFTSKVIGEISVKEIEKNKCKVSTKYTFLTKGLISKILCFLFVHLLWSGLQKKGLNNIKKLAENKEPYFYPR